MYATLHNTHIYTVVVIIAIRGDLQVSQNVEGDMSDTSIRVSDELADELFDRKRRGESYEDVMWRLIEQADVQEADDAEW
jgi:hypothetical protein